jgi:hypothetical protein
VADLSPGEKNGKNAGMRSNIAATVAEARKSRNSPENQQYLHMQIYIF